MLLHKYWIQSIEKNLSGLKFFIFFKHNNPAAIELIQSWVGNHSGLLHQAVISEFSVTGGFGPQITKANVNLVSDSLTEGIHLEKTASMYHLRVPSLLSGICTKKKKQRTPYYRLGLGVIRPSVSLGIFHRNGLGLSVHKDVTFYEEKKSHIEFKTTFLKIAF